MKHNYYLKSYRIRTRHQRRTGKWVWMSHRLNAFNITQARRCSREAHAQRHSVPVRRVEVVETLGGERLYPYVV